MERLIDPDHSPGILEKNKDLATQQAYLNGPILKRTFNNRSFYSQASGLVKRGSKHRVTEEDIWRLDEENTAQSLWDSFEPIWNEERTKPKPSLQSAVIKRFKGDFMEALGLMIAYSICTFINPVILPFLIDFVIDTSYPAYQGYIYVACIIISQLVGSFCYYLGICKGGILGINLRTVLTVLVYRKSLTMAPKKELNSGQVVNLISGDAFMFADAFWFFVMGLSGPFQVVTGILAICFPIALRLGKRAGLFYYLASLTADLRLKLTNELLQGIRIVKYYAWENAFQNNIEKQRDSELQDVYRMSLARSLAFLVMQNIGSLAQGLTLILYGLYGPNFSFSVVFTVVAIFNLIRQGFVNLPFTTTMIEMNAAALLRIEQFVVNPDISPVPKNESAEPGIDINSATFKWESSATPTLKNLTLKAKKGDFIMVVGPVGSGKSSVVSAILGELAVTSGSLTVNGSLAYVAQEAFIFNATVRENIIFGKPYDAEKYRRVIEASALMADLGQFTAGDKTEIGERGVNLSGGQKQRISVARALYSDADIILLDDPLSAVDSHVGKHLFHKAIKGHLADKLVLLTANQLQYLPYADHIIFLNEGDVVASGNFEELMQSNDMFKDQMTKFGVTGKGEESSDEEATNDKPKEQPKEITHPKTEELKKEANTGTLVADEEKQEGLIGFNVYWYYFKKGGLGVLFLILFFLVLAVGARVLSGWWLSVWLSNGATTGYILTLPVYVGIYGALIGVDVIGVTISSIIDVVWSIRASKRLHHGMLSRIIRAPTSFFDITPMGRIVNRLAKELDLIDKTLPYQLYQYITSILTLLSVLASMAFASPYFLIAIAVTIVGYYFFQWNFRKTFVETQRMEALSRAPIFSQIGETWRGAATIRAYRMEQVFRNVNNHHLDENSRQRIAQRYLLSWFGLVLDGMGTALVLILMVLIVSLRVTGAGDLQGGYAAFALASTAGLTPILSALALNAVETEAKVNSVERIKEYDDLEQEAPAVIKENRPPKEWPEKGRIEFKDASLRYRQGELVLKKLNVTIDGEEKVGIVGRTGAGKSTLLQALFRMVELAGGSIEIDGIDIATIGLADLRSKLSIIPQEPVLFLGTVRYNLDPFGDHSDDDLWEALSMVNLKNYVTSLEGGLNAAVEENGSNFSVGQRQLMCMSRALLRKTKILVMDEATASVDLETDLLIQSMVRKNFSDRTSLTIAHRLNTVMDSTKVLVLNRGELAEYGKPAQLLENTSGIFSSMVEATGPEQSKFLKKIATGEVGLIEGLKEVLEESEKEPK